MFFVGMHQPSDANRVPAAFISVNRLRRRKKALGCRRWIMDSGAFTEISLHGGYRDAPDIYAAEIRRWAREPGLLAAVSQDYMCEPFILAKTGLTVAEHQRLTIERYDAIVRAGTAGVYLMPVLQGYAPAEYVAHIRQYGGRLPLRAWVGVGSVCKRNSTPAAVENVVLAIKRARPDLRLHGFGLKITSLASGIVRDALFSADSMSWSYAARMEGRNGNDWREAARFGRRVRGSPVQLGMLGVISP